MSEGDIYDRMGEMVGLFQRMAFLLDDVGEALTEGRTETAMYLMGLAHAKARESFDQARDIHMKALAEKGMREGDE